MHISKIFACSVLAAALGVSASVAEEAAGLQAVIETDKGTIRLELYPDHAPVTVASFVNLAERGFFDGLTFHRVDPGFVIQGGDPQGRGTGGPGYVFENEPHEDLRHDGAGVLGMANPGPNRNGSQFYITLGPAPHLDGGYTVFGKVLSGMEVVRAIRRGDKMTEVTIEGDAAALKAKMEERLAEWNKVLDKP